MTRGHPIYHMLLTHFFKVVHHYGCDHEVLRNTTSNVNYYEDVFLSYHMRVLDSILYSCLNIKVLLARNRRDI